MSVRAHAASVLICTALISCFAYAGDYQAVLIYSPEPNTTVHDNSGNLTVTVAVSPPLRTEEGDHLSLLLDGKEVASGSAQNFELTAIDRGSHTLRVQVMAADGAVLVASPPVDFQMWRASRLFPSRAK